MIDLDVNDALPWERGFTTETHDADPEHTPDEACGCDLCVTAFEELSARYDARRADDIAHHAARLIECPTCDGHGDVPSGRYSLHNPTGLVACPRCNGDRYVTCDTRGEGPHVAYDADEIAALRAEAV